VLDRAIFRSF